MLKKGLLIVISGPAGSGKGTVNSILLQKEGYAFSVSATTRAPRPGEQNGRDYWFIDREAFEKRIDEGRMLEYTEYCGNYYGTPLQETEKMLSEGKNVILEIDVKGAMNVRARYPEALLIMLLPPSFKVQEERLRGRGTETEEKIRWRLERSHEEIPLVRYYDYVVYNPDNGIEACAEEIHGIVMAEKHATKRNPDVVKEYFGE